MTEPKQWWIYRGAGPAAERLARLAEQVPPWREFGGGPLLPAPEADAGTRLRGDGYLPDAATVDAVNTALYLRRPLLVTGKPGVGKSTLAHSVAADLGLGPVLHWPVTSRSALRDALYTYDAIGRLNDANLQQFNVRVEGDGSRVVLNTGQGGSERSEHAERDASFLAPYLRLGPLGTALLPHPQPRVLLVDEIDKSDIDLPGDLLTVFEEGSFEIPELARVAAQEPFVAIGTADDPEHRVRIARGVVRCHAFPFVVLTSNGERDFPPAFLRRCIRLHLDPPDPERLARIVRQRLGLGPDADDGAYRDLIASFLQRRQEGDLATDQLLNAVQLRLAGAWTGAEERERFLDLVLQRLTGPPSP